MKFILSILAVMMSVFVQAQTFDVLIQEADSLFHKENFKASAKKFEKAFQIKEGEAKKYYKAACAWAAIGDTIETFKHLNKAAKKGWRHVKWLENNRFFKSLHSTQNWPKIVQVVEANKAVFESKFDQALKARLETVLMKDQAMRFMSMDAEKRYGKESEEVKYLWTIINVQDSLNLLEVEKILMERGWAGKSLVGDDANMGLWLVIQHAPLKVQEKYLPLLRASVEKGESNKSNLALLEDRILEGNGQPQIYGSQIVTDSKTGKTKVHEIKDPEFVNKRRRSVGLGPIENYLKNMGVEMEWTIQQKE